MSATALGSRLMVRNSLVAYSATPPASTVDAPRFLGPRSSRHPPRATAPICVMATTLRAQPHLRSSVCRKELFQARGVHAPEFLLQIRDLVADPGGQLELEVPRGRHHLCGEVLDQVGE